MQRETKQEPDGQAAGRGFADELRAFGAAIPHKALFAALLLAWLALFHFFGHGTMGYLDTPSLFGWLQHRYVNAEDDNIGPIIPFLVVGLLWWKRDELGAVPKRVWWPPLALFILALLLHVAGYTVQQGRFSLVGFFLGLYALTGLLWGWAWLRATFFPFFLFAFMMPLTNDMDSLTLPLQILAARLTVVTGHVLGIEDLIRQGTQLVHAQRGFHYEVEAACSGLRSLTVMLAMSSAFAFVLFERNWKRALIILSAVPLAITSNLLRLTGVVIGGTWKYDQMIADHQPVSVAVVAAPLCGMAVHDHWILKYLPYIVGFVGMMLLARCLPEDARAGEGKAS